MKFLTTLFLLFSLSSCYHVYYSPGTPNVTQFTEKDEVRINAGVISGFESEFNGGDLQFAYAPAKNIGIMLNGFTASSKEGNNDAEKGSGSYGEFAVGYFTTLDKQKEWTFEVFGGVGGGSVNNVYSPGESSKVNVNKVFLQPALGYKWDYLEFAFAPRFAHVNWKLKETKGAGTDVGNDLEYVRNKPNFFSFEPGLILRGGSKKIKGQLAVTLASKHAEANLEGAPIESFVAYLGVSLNLSTKKKPSVSANVIR